jgi:uncharacterized membrane protein YczE
MVRRVSARSPSTWHPSLARLARLLFGLSLFGAGEAMLVGATLGNSPWTVLAQGVARQTELSIGSATIAISIGVLMIWIPLRQLPGLGTVLNAVLIGVVIGGVLALLPHRLALLDRYGLVVAGIALVSIGSGLYLTSQLGPGPRDGLMTGLHARTGLSLRLVRTGIESSAVLCGFLLGGRVGVGTLAFAALIGPGVQAAVHSLGGLRIDQAAPPPY